MSEKRNNVNNWPGGRGNGPSRKLRSVGAITSLVCTTPGLGWAAPSTRARKGGGVLPTVDRRRLTDRPTNRVTDRLPIRSTHCRTGTKSIRDNTRTKNNNATSMHTHAHTLLQHVSWQKSLSPSVHESGRDIWEGGGGGVECGPAGRQKKKKVMSLSKWGNQRDLDLDLT